MKILTPLFFVAFLLGGCTKSADYFDLEKGLLIKNARIVSSEDLSISEDSYIVVEKENILHVGLEAPELSGEYQIVDAKGKFVIPGLIDGHVHVTSTDGLSDEEELENPDLVDQYRTQLPKSYLYFGYTTLIDLGTSKPKRLSEFNAADLKPDLFYVGEGAVIGNGYGLSNWNDSIPNFIYQEDENYPIPKEYLKDNHTPEAVIKRISESRAIAVKTYYEPGFDPSTPPLPTPSVELIENIKSEAHRYNLVLVVHGNSLKAHSFLAEAQVDIIAHGLWNWGNERLGDDNQIPNEVSKTLDLEIENDIAYMPTLQVINGLNSLTKPDFLNDPELVNVLPESLINYYKENTELMYLSVFGDAPKEIINTNFNRISEQGKVALNYLHKKNGKILFATDTPSSPTYGNPPGYNGFMEMIEMVNAGIPLGAIYKSATIENARAFKLDSLYGSIEAEKRANILILDENPLDHVSAYNKISKVIMHGEVYDRETLSAVRNKTNE